jgi:enolase
MLTWDEMSTVIEEVGARKVFNSRGEETIEVEILTRVGFGRASAPSGASRGKAEATPYPNGGVDEAVEIVNQLIEPKLVGMKADDQAGIDILLHSIDQTESFGKIGGNTAFAISLAAAEAAANSFHIPLFQYLGGYLANELPYPLGNVLGGGKHTLGKSPDIQEYLVLPVGASTFLDAAKANILTHQKVGSLLKDRDKAFNGGRNDEGAWVCALTNEEALEVVAEACEEASDELGFTVQAGLDIAASTLWNPTKERYIYSRAKKEMDTGEQLDFILDLIKTYKLAYVEDPFHEEDFESFTELTKRAEDSLICGDDLFVTNKKRLQHGIEAKAANSIIIKVNQVGTLSDAWETTQTAKKFEYVPVISHRSGDTTDKYIAHLAVAFRCPIIKTGVVGGARIAKLNELIRIEEMLGNKAKMAKL